MTKGKVSSNKKLSVIIPYNVKRDGYYKKAYEITYINDNCYNLKRMKLWIQDNINYGSLVLKNLKEDIDTSRKEVSDLKQRISDLEVSLHGYE